VPREPARAKPLPRRDPPPEIFTGIAPHDLDEATARALRLEVVAS